MIKINVAEIKKQLIGSASYHYELDPEALDLTEDDVSLEGQVVADLMEAFTFLSKENVDAVSNLWCSPWFPLWKNGTIRKERRTFPMMLSLISLMWLMLRML